MNIQLITADLALLLCPVALSAATPKQSTLRVVASTQQISQPQGLWQVSPTLFYTTSNQTILSVTTGGEVGSFRGAQWVQHWLCTGYCA